MIDAIYYLATFFKDSFVWLFQGISYVAGGVVCALLRNVQTLVSWFVLVLAYVFGVLNAIVDWSLYFLLNSAWALVGTLDIDLSSLQENLVLGGQTLYALNRYFALQESLAILAVYFSLLSYIYITRIVLKLIPTIA